jgi:hypothetical protein
MVTVEVNGTDLVIKALNKVELDILNKLPKEFSQISQYLEGEVKQSVAGQKEEDKSFDTGNFLNHIYGRSGEDYAMVFTNVDYAKYLEFAGPSNHWKNRGHFRNTLLRNQVKIKEYLQEAINSALK